MVRAFLKKILLKVLNVKTFRFVFTRKHFKLYLIILLFIQVLMSTKLQFQFILNVTDILKP